MFLGVRRIVTKFTAGGQWHWVAAYVASAVAAIIPQQLMSVIFYIYSYSKNLFNASAGTHAW